MDFFGAQDQARTRSRRLIYAFAVCVLGVVLGVYFVVAFALVTAGEIASLFDPPLFLAVAVIIGGTILIATATRFAAWRSGGGAVARSLGGREIPADPSDPLERRLRNVVEEMAIASGLPIPEVFVLDQEDGINAFAAGHHPGDAAVAVTRGALRRLSRDELQGVMAHEFSHIRHGDMAINLRMAGFAFGLAALAFIGYIVFRSAGMMGRSRSKEAGAVGLGLFAIGAAVWLLGSLGELAARLLQAAVSRQREFLADAAAVQFTRHPAGLTGALRRIQAEADGSKVKSSHARETAHLFFAPALRSGLSGMLATHPPLVARLRALDPQGLHASTPLAPPPEVEQNTPSPARGGRPTPVPIPQVAAVAAVAGLAGGATTPATPPTLPKSPSSEANPGPAALAAAGRDLGDLPPAVRAAAGSALTATAVTLLLATADHQGPPPLPAAPDALSSAELTAALRDLAPVLNDLPRCLRLVALEHIAPAFRRLGPAENIALRRRLTRLVYEDQQVTAYEFSLLLLAQNRLTAPPTVATGDFRPFAADAAAVLATLARTGETPTDEVAPLLARVAREVDLPALPPVPAMDVEAVLAAADRLRALPWHLRPTFLAAAALIVTADGRRTAGETDLVRAFAHALDSPLPAFQS